MKKVLVLAVAALAFVACGNNNQAAEEVVEVIDSTAVEVAPVEEVVDSAAAVVEEAAEAVVEAVTE